MPIMKPLLICVLDCQKELGAGKEKVNAGEFVFLSNTPDIDMRNIVQGSEYFALLFAAFVVPKTICKRLPVVSAHRLTLSAYSYFRRTQ